MGGVFSAVGSLFKGVTNTVGSLLGGNKSSSVNVTTPTVENAAVAQSAPETSPTEQTAANTLNRKRKGKSALTIPTSGSGTGGTGLNV